MADYLLPSCHLHQTAGTCILIDTLITVHFVGCLPQIVYIFMENKVHFDVTTDI